MNESPLVGSQAPTFEWVPDSWDSSAGQDAIEMSRACGLFQDPWQENILTGLLGEEPDDSWTVNEAGIIVGRQNGKGSIIEARELSGIFVFGERLIFHSAHEARTALSAFERMRVIVESNPDLDRKVMAIARSKGEEGFTFKVDGHTARLRYLTRTTGGGRGLTKCDLCVLDEAMILDEGPIAALLPTMATAPRWQVLYTASAGDVKLPTSSRVLARVRRRGLRREARLALWMWEAHLRHTKTCHTHRPDDLDEAAMSCRKCAEQVPLCVTDDRDDPRTWAKTMPSMGIVRQDGSRGVSASFLRQMKGAMATWDFDREYLGVGDYPEDDGWSVFGEDDWADLWDADSRRGPAFAVGIEVAWDRSSASVSIAARRVDGLVHVEVCHNAPGYAWAVPFAAAMKAKRPCAFVVDKKSPAGVLIPDLIEAGIREADVITPTLPEFATWSGKAFEMVTESRGLRHLNQPTMNEAVKVAQKRDLGQGTFVWERADLAGDGTPWLASTMALGGLLVRGTRPRRRPLVASSHRVTRHDLGGTV